MRVAPSSNSNSSAHILLVDDNKLGLTARKAVLQEIGFIITTAGSGKEGLERFAEEDIELVVTDYKMPRMNGVDFIKRIRKQAPSTPIILLSGFADTLGLDEENTGADMVIQKSANEVTHMVRAVRRLLRQKTPKKPPAAHRQRTKTKRASG